MVEEKVIKRIIDCIIECFVSYFYREQPIANLFIFKDIELMP